MNASNSLNLIQRGIAMCMAAMVTLAMLGGIDQLAHQQQASDAWAAAVVNAERG